MLLHLMYNIILIIKFLFCLTVENTIGKVSMYFSFSTFILRSVTSKYFAPIYKNEDLISSVFNFRRYIFYLIFEDKYNLGCINMVSFFTLGFNYDQSNQG